VPDSELIERGVKILAEDVEKANAENQ